MKHLPILSGQIMARACDWKVEEKGGAGGFKAWGKRRKERGRRWRKNRWEKDRV